MEKLARREDWNEIQGMRLVSMIPPISRSTLAIASVLGLSIVWILKPLLANEASVVVDAAPVATVEPAASPAEAPAMPSATPSGPVAVQNTEAITAAMGMEITVEGIVSRIGESKTRQILFINFTEVTGNGITVIIKQGTLAGDVVQYDPEFGNRLVGKKIRVTGEVTEYRGEPQIQVFAPSQMEVVAETP